MSSSCNYYCCTNLLTLPPPPPPPRWNLQNIWDLGFHSLNFELQMVRLPLYHMEEMVLQTCERYAPAGGLFYMSCIEAIHHLGGTRRRQELHLCWQQLKVSFHGNRNVLFANNVILHRQDFGTVAVQNTKAEWTL